MGNVAHRFAAAQPDWTSRLAAVELQLILQQLDTQSKLRLARCCRRTLAAASDALAWVGAAPVRVSFHSMRTLPSPGAQSALQRCVPLTLCNLYSLQDEWQARLEPHAPFFGLDAARLSPATIQAALQLPSLQRLRWLRINTPLREAAEAETLLGLPLLQSLVLDSGIDDQPAALLPLLQAGALPQLTALQCRAVYWNDKLSRAAFAGQLRELSLIYGLGKGGSVDLVAGPLSALQRLRLLSWRLHVHAPMGSAEWPAVLSSLRSLQSLELEDTMPTEQLLEALDGVPTLSELHCTFPLVRGAVPARIKDALQALQKRRRSLLLVAQPVATRVCTCCREDGAAGQPLPPVRFCQVGSRQWDAVE